MSEISQEALERMLRRIESLEKRLADMDVREAPSGDMKKAVYDPDGDGKVVSAASADSASDAGSVDGVDSSWIVHGWNSARTGRVTSMDAEHPSGFYDYSNPTGAPVGDWIHWLTSQHGNLPSWYAMQLASAFHSDNNFYLRRVEAGTPKPWHKILTDQDHHCSVVRALSSQTLVNSTWTPITFDYIRENVGGMYNAGAPTRITIQATGKYVAWGLVAFTSNANGDRAAGIKINAGGNPNSGYWLPIVGTNAIGTVGWGTDVECKTHIMSLVAGDYLELFAIQSSGGNLNLDVNFGAMKGFNTFNCMRIR